MAGTLVDGVWPCRAVSLRVTAAQWPLAMRDRTAIDAAWSEALAANPRYFNGTVFVLRYAQHTDEMFEAEVGAAEFKTFLYWRDDPRRDPAVRDVFGTAVVVGADGAVMLGVQGAGQLNTGLAYPPGGLIDPRDLRPDGTIDIAASIARELLEETGLGPAAASGGLVSAPGFLVTVADHFVSIAIVYRSPERARQIADRVTAFIKADRDPELERVVFVASLRDAAGIPSPPHVALLIAHLFPD